jgi:hypothetical protein
MSEKQKESLLDMDSILNQSIDDVETAPEFVVPPDGAYVLGISDCKLEEYDFEDKESKEKEKRTRIKIFYAVASTTKLASEEESPVPVGSLFTEQFMTNPQGLSYFKRQAKNVLGEENIKGVTIGEIIKELPNNHFFNADVRVKESKVGEKTYRNVQVRIHQGDPLNPPLDEVAEQPA